MKLVYTALLISITQICFLSHMTHQKQVVYKGYLQAFFGIAIQDLRVQSVHVAKYRYLKADSDQRHPVQFGELRSCLEVLVDLPVSVL